MKNMLITLFALFVVQIMSSQTENDSITPSQKIDSYIQKADSIIESKGSDLAKFIGKVRGHNFFRRIEKNLLDPVNIELSLIKNSDVKNNKKLKEAYDNLLNLHNNSISQMQAEISAASGYESVFKVKLKNIYKKDKKQIEKLATDFIDLSYNLRNNQKHAGIIEIVLVVFKIEKLIKKFGVKLEENAKPIIIQNLDNHKLKAWEDVINN